MGQKANLQTIRKRITNINLINSSPKEFLTGFNFLNYFTIFLRKKNLILTSVNLNFIGNHAQLNLELYYRTALLKNLRHQRRKKKLAWSLTPQFLIQSILKELNTIGIELLSINYIYLNKQTIQKKNFIRLLYLRFKTFQDSIFPRRVNLFFDFLKLSSLYSNGLVNTKSFLFLLGQIFKFLLKKQHNRFLSLLKKLFKIYINKSLYNTSKTNILGLKFLISGRLKGKLRTQRKSLKFGTVPNQTLSKNIDFGKTEVYTRYCVFGLKLWTYRKT
jgi:hypothetical protein